MKIFFSFVTVLLCFLQLHAQDLKIQSGVYHLDSMQVGQAKPRLQGSTLDLNPFSFHASTLMPGKENHALKSVAREELIVVKQGPLTIQVNDSVASLSTGSIALILPGDLQQFRNESDHPVSYFVLGFTSVLPVDSLRGRKGGGSLLKDWNALPVKPTAKGESRAVFDRPSFMFDRFEVHATLLRAGMDSHSQHTHRQEEVMLLMRGNVTMHLGDRDIPTSTGSLIFVNANEPHHLTNTGDSECWYYAIKYNVIH
jgi:quercetin dioxygenase-like cupin family protein